MNDMERRKFEDSFKDAFQDAQMEPTDGVWTNIELDLEKASGGEMKRRLLFYKLLAAASITFAMCVAGVGYFTYNDTPDAIASTNSTERASSSNDNALQQTENSEKGTSSANNAGTNDKEGKSEIASANADTTDPQSSQTTAGTEQNASTDQTNVPTLPSLAQQEKDKPIVDRRIRNKATGEKSLSRGEGALAATEAGTTTDEKTSQGSIENLDTAGKSLAVNDPYNNEKQPAIQYSSEGYSMNAGGSRPLTPLVVLKEPQVPEKQESTADPFKLMMARLDDEARAMNEKATKKNKKNNSEEKLWTSVGMAAGGYNTVNRSVSNSIHSKAVQTANNQTRASGTAYSVGVSVATKIAERWVVQGGVNYLNQVSDYTSNVLVAESVNGQFSAINGSNAGLLNMASDEVSSRAKIPFGEVPPFGISSTMEYITIPFQAGYLLLNKKVGVQMNAGVSTDLFLKNKESANVNGAGASVQQHERGSSDSPFRDVNFSGLLGTEVSYKVGNHYRVAVTPGVRYPFNSMYKSDSQIQATPVTFDIGLKFRYIFQ
jgi:hypothetical protein